MSDSMRIKPDVMWYPYELFLQFHVQLHDEHINQNRTEEELYCPQVQHFLALIPQFLKKKKITQKSSIYLPNRVFSVIGSEFPGCYKNACVA